MVYEVTSHSVVVTFDQKTAKHQGLVPSATCGMQEFEDFSSCE